MAEINSRVQRAIEELTGNEALLEMLETDAAVEMLNWGTEMVATVVEETEGPDDRAAEEAAMPRLKAVRQVMRSAGNWAAGKYVDPASRVPLRDKLLEHFSTIFGPNADLPSASEMDGILRQVDDKQKTPHQLLLTLKEALNEPHQGDTNVEVS